MPHVIERAPTARSKCRGCGQQIASGAMRFGEAVPNPFAEGDTTHWYHLECGAFKRPEAFLAVAETSPEPLEDAERLLAEARLGVAHPRLARVNGAERAASGRAQCRSCRAAIEKGAWRITLVFWEEGRFAAAGYVHPRCGAAYFETGAVMPRVKRFSAGLGEDDLKAVEAELQAPGP
jgi:ribosomal protein L37AE/L43A